MAKVIYDNTKNTDLFYALRVEIPDAFFYIDTDTKKYVFLDHREFGVFEEHNKNKTIECILLNPFIQEATTIKDQTSLPNKLALLLFQKYNLTHEDVAVPERFPVDMADFLRSKGIKLTPTIPFFPERLLKSKAEQDVMRNSLYRTYPGLEHVEKMLQESTIEHDTIVYRGNPLTSELIQKEIDRILLEHDMLSTEGMIVSSGGQAAMPHHRGAGLLRPHQTIICDLFPKNRTTGYFADITRTYVKGKPTDQMQKMYDAVIASQGAGIAAARAGIKGVELHEICATVFRDKGYDVGDKGFIHGTGHGLGLDVHERPYANANSDETLQVGHVVTMEPGLYYPEIGGVRIEDVLAIIDNGCENLTDYPKRFVIL